MNWYEIYNIYQYFIRENLQSHLQKESSAPVELSELQGIVVVSSHLKSFWPTEKKNNVSSFFASEVLFSECQKLMFFLLKIMMFV